MNVFDFCDLRIYTYVYWLLYTAVKLYYNTVLVLCCQELKKRSDRSDWFGSEDFPCRTGCCDWRAPPTTSCSLQRRKRCR